MKDLITLKNLTLNAAMFILFLVSINSLDIKKQFTESRIGSIESINSSVKLYCPDPPGFREVVNSNSKGLHAGSALYNSEPGNVKDESGRLIEKLKRDEYNISYSDELGTYQSPNSSNNLRFIYHKDGFTAHTREVKRVTSEGKRLSNVSDEWSIDFRLRDLGRTDNKSINNDMSSMFNRELKASGNKASIEDENIRIDYTNTEEGMRQDFIVKVKPLGEGKLRLNISADTKLKMKVGANEVKFQDKKGDEKMNYSSLKVWDANGRELKAYFEKTEKLQITNYKLQIENRKSQIRNSKSQIKTSPKLFSIVVNDEDAVYPVTVDPLSSTANWTAESNQGNALFGWSVATAGDVNGDGYSDVIVGAYNYDNVLTDLGRAYLFYGSSNGLSTTAGWTAQVNQPYAHFGNSVSTAGDVNGDGYSDVIVGALGFDGGNEDEGKVFVYYGSSTGLSPTPAWSMEGQQDSAYFGCSVSTAGDVNGDGYNDIIIGSYKYNNGEIDEGRAYVYLGSSAGLPDSANWISEGNQTNSYFGSSVSTAGDVNGDGFSDVIIGAPFFDNGQTDEGKVFVYYGSLTGLSSSVNWSTEGNQIGTQYGNSVSTAGDVNGDGYSDLIIGHYLFHSPTDYYVGKVIVFYGSISGLNTLNWAYSSNQFQANLGNSVSCAGDVNGDGYSDIIAGAYGFDNNITNEGMAIVFLGSSAGMSSAPYWTTYGNQETALFGNCVASAGDVNGDGYSDVIVGSHWYDAGQTDEGKTFVYHGSADGLSTSIGNSRESDQDSAQIGYSVSAAGDINGDGYCDVIAGAPFCDNGETDEGKVYVYNGSSSGISATASWTAEADLDSALFGTCVAGAGDVNGDGFSDVIVGAPLFKNSPSNTYGKVFVYYGSAAGLSNTAGWSATGSQTNKSLFGNNVSSAGDVNGDGYGDILIGENKYANGQFDEGRTYLYYGSASGLLSTPAWTYESNNSNANLGISTSSAGDVNGDGFSDIVIGAYTFSNGQVAEGRTFVFHGSSSGLPAAADWTYETNVVNSYFGWSVSSAGDVNGDGFGDVIIGARYYNNGQIGEGRTYVFHGSTSGLLSTPNRTYESNQVNAYMGWSVSSAGDVNSDGYSDVLISIKNYDNGQTDEGRVFAMYGSSAGLPVNQNWSAEGNQTSAYFGQSVSSAGDVNGDGFSDIIIGASLYDNGQPEEGRIFTYFGNGRTGKKADIQQYKTGTNNIVYAGSYTGTNGQVKFNIYGKSSYGKAKGKIVYEYKANGNPFSGTNSLTSSGEGTFTELGTSGTQLSIDVSGIPTNYLEYKWRARIQYDLVSNPYQKFGPWKYYQNNFPVSFGGFKPKEIPFTIRTLNLTMLIQGFYDSGSDAMVPDTVWTYLRNSSSPYTVIDSSKTVVNSSGQGVFNFANALNGVNYYLDLRHRNSIETWSNTAQAFTSSQMTYNFTSANTQAFGNNLLQINATPQKYGIYNGDENQNGFVDLTDVVNVFNAAGSFTTGYVPSDMNGDNITDLADLILTNNNASAFVAKVIP